MKFSFAVRKETALATKDLPLRLKEVPTSLYGSRALHRRP